MSALVDPDRESRHIQIEALLCAERGEGYAAAFRAAVAAVLRFAGEQAGMHGLTRGADQSVRNCIADLIGRARHDASEALLPVALAEELRTYAIAEMDQTLARLGTRRRGGR